MNEFESILYPINTFTNKRFFDEDVLWNYLLHSMNLSNDVLILLKIRNYVNPL